MTIVNPNLPANLFIHTATHPANTPEERQLDLRLEQIVQATVVEGGLNKAILEMNQQRYRAQTEQELQVGRKLTLQVLQIHPRLEFKVLNDPLSDKLGQLLPLLTRPYNWGRLVTRLQQLPSQTALPQSISQVYSRLQQILNPAGGMSVNLKENISQLAAQLQQLTTSSEVTPKENFPPPQQIMLQPMIQKGQLSAVSELSRTMTQLIKNLQEQLLLLPQQAEQPLPKNWYSETRKFLAPLQQDHGLSQIPASQRQLLVTVLHQLYQHPKMSPQLAGELEHLLIRIKRQVSSAVFQQTKSAAVTVKNPLVDLTRISAHDIAGSAQTVSAKGAANLAQLSAAIKTLLTQVQHAQQQKQGLSPELSGRLEGLLSRLQQLPQAPGTTQTLLPGFELIVSRLSRLVTQKSSSPQGGQLGFLSQLFGFYLETELLHGKRKDALASLKLSLLSLQKELGEEVKEPLRRLELFQFCKAKLAEDQIQFLPLPFNELEEGYLLAEKQHGQDDGDLAGEPPVQISLSIRLSALGNIRIDMFYEKQGLYLRLAGENQEKMGYLQKCADELKEALKTIELYAVSFSADAQFPAQQLRERLLPDLSNILDARV